MSYEIVDLDERIVCGTAINTTNENNKSINDIGLAWKRFFEDGTYNAINNKINNKTIGLYTDFVGDYTKPYLFLTCCEVNVFKEADKEKDIIFKRIQKGKYAKFTAKGDLQKAVGEGWKEIWSTNLNRKYVSDFEEYSNSDEINIYIGLNE